MIVFKWSLLVNVEYWDNNITNIFRRLKDILVTVLFWNYFVDEET